MSNVYEEALRLHEKHQGKISVQSKVPVNDAKDLSLAYSPGVAEPCRHIHQHQDNVYRYTSKGNMVAVVTDGSAVLGLGNIGPYAALPVMEGKAVLFKEFAGVDAIPICLNTQDTDEIIETCKRLEPSIGGINLEDIAAPRCIDVENRLKQELSIPVFHDDQHGTAIVTIAALLNACRLTGKQLENLKIVISGTGAAGSAIMKMLHQLGVKDLHAYNSRGILHHSKRHLYDTYLIELLEYTNQEEELGDDSLAHVVTDADVFIGVSVGGLLTKEMVEGMKPHPIIFAMANPQPEIMPEEARQAGAKIIGTGRSDYPNQINNVLAFPGVFRGALDARATEINDTMKLAASYAIAHLISDEELTEDYIIPSPFDRRVVEAVRQAVYEAAIQTNVARIL